jgi:hypothetical protein
MTRSTLPLTTGTTTDSTILPNFIYIGTSKAGSTWIFNLLSHHPDVFMVPNKGLYFFDSHYDRGLDWYLSHFAASGDYRVRCEISHSYLHSNNACQRIAELNPDVKLMVCVREPADRAFSEYLDLVKNNRFRGTFEEALRERPSLTDYGRYYTHLRPYYEQFGPDRIFVAVFDDIKNAPAELVERMFSFLDIKHVVKSAHVTQNVNAGGIPRFAPLVRSAKWGSKTLKRLGMRRPVGFAKRSAVIKNVLYRPFTERNRPAMHEEMRVMLRNKYQEEIRQFDDLVGTNLRSLWGYVSDY